VGLGSGDRWLLAISGLLLLAAALTHYLPTGPVVPFAVSAVALAAVAALTGRAVSGLADRLGSGATGVLQSALGNIPELLFGIFALRKGLIGVVQATIVGSFLSNVLLVLGGAALVGGLRHGPQRFATEGPRMLSLLLLLAVAILAVPSTAAFLHVPAAAHEGDLSMIASIVLLGIFALAVPASLRGAANAGEDAGAEHGWPLAAALGLLVVSACAAAAVSDWFVAALTPALPALHISQAFAGIVIVALAGNAVENVVGMQLAARNRMDYALSAILQSPLQVALVVAPALVLLSGALGTGSRLTLAFPPLEIVSLALTAIISVVVVFDGEATWLEGACLIGLYVVLAATFWWG